MGNWDDIARTGGWDLGRHPPMALGVEAAGVATRTGGAVAGDRVMTHSLPLRAQGAWAEWFVAAASDVAPVPFEVAAALPVPTLTADQVLRGALGAVKNGGRLATITSDPPDAERGIKIRQVYVAPDGPRLARLGELLAAGTIGVAVDTPFPLEHAARALTYLQQGTRGQAVVLQPGPIRS